MTSGYVTIEDSKLYRLTDKSNSSTRRVACMFYDGLEFFRSSFLVSSITFVVKGSSAEEPKTLKSKGQTGCRRSNRGNGSFTLSLNSNCRQQIVVA